MANPHAGSIKRVEYAENEPATGNSTASSPRACTVQYSIMPTSTKQISSEAGPPCARDLPDVTKRPVPMGCQSRPFSITHDGPLTNGPSDGNHLQVSALELSCQWRICGSSCRIYRVKNPTIRADYPSRRHCQARIPPEAIDESIPRPRARSMGFIEIMLVPPWIVEARGTLIQLEYAVRGVALFHDDGGETRFVVYYFPAVLAILNVTGNFTSRFHIGGWETQ
jgi:hypothetical protein